MKRNRIKTRLTLRRKWFLTAPNEELSLLRTQTRQPRRVTRSSELNCASNKA